MKPSVFESFEIKPTFVIAPKSCIQDMIKFTTKLTQKEKLEIIDQHFLVFIKDNLHELTCDSMKDDITVNFCDSNFDLNSQENALIDLLNGLEHFSRSKNGLINDQTNFTSEKVLYGPLAYLIDQFMEELVPSRLLLGVKILWDIGLKKNALLLCQLVALLSNQYYYKYNS